jgi:hypothetical protein
VILEGLAIEPVLLGQLANKLASIEGWVGSPCLPELGLRHLQARLLIGQNVGWRPRSSASSPELATLNQVRKIRQHVRRWRDSRAQEPDQWPWVVVFIHSLKGGDPPRAVRIIGQPEGTIDNVRRNSFWRAHQPRRGSSGRFRFTLRSSGIAGGAGSIVTRDFGAFRDLFMPIPERLDEPAWRARRRWRPSFGSSHAAPRNGRTFPSLSALTTPPPQYVAQSDISRRRRSKRSPRR